jgi:phosphohistidine phosphatase
VVGGAGIKPGQPEPGVGEQLVNGEAHRYRSCLTADPRTRGPATIRVMSESVHLLLLLRHAKSSWDDPGLADHDRPLAPRGRKAAKRIGRHLRDQGPEVSLALCSSARRARDTLSLVAPGGDIEIEIEPELYGAGAGELLERLRRVPDDAGTVMLVGHNPAIQELLVSLARDPGDLAVRKFPTGALATLAVNGSWGALAAGQAELAALVVPREL